ncbi:MAG: hypothetical protein ABSF13_10565 [Smithella sp.]|jgi:hypothetical protein
MFIDDNEVIVRGRFVKIALFREEWDIDVNDPELVIKKIMESSLNADIFTFQQRLPESKPKFNYHMEWDNVAALPIKDYDIWFKTVLHQNPRNKIKISEKKGVETKIFDFNDDTLKGIIKIYHENPLRQGTPFLDYNIDWDTAKKANITFIDRATFIGAYYKNELIGFIKLVSTGKYARTMGILGKIAHRDKAPMNLLIAKAVAICAEKKIPYLVYGKFSYGKVGSKTLQNFKLYFGFESIVLPRYYIPLNTWGKIMIKLNLHQGIVGIMPKKLVRILINLRNKWNNLKYAQ